MPRESLAVLHSLRACRMRYPITRSITCGSALMVQMLFTGKAGIAISARSNSVKVSAGRAGFGGSQQAGVYFGGRSSANPQILRNCPGANDPSERCDQAAAPRTYSYHQPLVPAEIGWARMT